MKASLKINQFYIVLVVLMIILSVLIIVSLRGIFGAISLAGEVDQELLSSTLPRVEVNKLNEALESVEGKEFTPLDF